jgi:hypothetical protein
MMNDAEFKLRYERYKKKFTTHANPPRCNVCNDEAELCDTASGEYYCETCLVDDLLDKDNVDFFKEHTEH